MQPPRPFSDDLLEKNSTMQEAQIVVGVASLCSLLAIVATVVVVPSLYSEINEIAIKVHDGVQAFRVETDSAWTDLMDLQISVTPPSKPRQNPARVCNSRPARPAHRDRPEHLDNREYLGNPVELDNREHRDSNQRLARLIPHHASAALPDHQDNPEAKDLKAVLEPLVSLDSPDAIVVKACLVLPGLRARLANPVALADLDSRDSPAHQELPLPPYPARRELQAHPDNLDNPVCLVSPENPVAKVSPERRARLDTRDNREHPVSLEGLELLECPEAMQPTVLALLAMLCFRRLAKKA
uniref:Col_cuticle_N domain-containing protein n=1 Tax=Globodera pallida TaxID=36090 RepID=A0A183C4J3_GLOPA